MLGCKGFSYIVSGQNPLIKFTATSSSCLELVTLFITPVHTGLSCCLCIFHLPFAVAMVLGPFVQELISTNPRLNCNLYFFFPLFKSIFGIIFCVLFKASNSHILDKKKFDWIFFKNFQIWNQISHLQPGPGFIQERIKSFSLLFVDLTPKPDYGYKASLCSSLAVISSQAWSQQMNMTFKGRMLEVARKTRRWKLDIAGRNSPGGNWFKYLTKVWKSCTQGKRKKHRITQIAPK